MLHAMGVVFSAVPSGFDEPAHNGAQAPEDYVRSNAQGKALQVAGRFGGELVIGADTVVAYRRRVMGKPANEREAFSSLRLLAGKTHAVYTGLALVDTGDGSVQTDCAKTLVRFRNLTDREISSYLARINPLDKAGAYAIQDEGAIIVSGIKGCYYNVMGFPVSLFEGMLMRRGASLFDYMK